LFRLAIAALSLFATAAVRADDAQIAARVNGEPIYARQVQHELQQALKGRALSPEEAKVAREQMRDQLVDRRLVMAYLKSTQQAASPQDVDFELEQLLKRLKARERPLADYLKSLDITEADLRDEFAWKISWKRYLERYVTPENLQKYFDQNRREFDGTQLRVAHILLKADPNDAAQIEAARKKAGEIREQIASGKLTFVAAAQQHSQSPSAENGGDIGLIERHQPMPEAFSQAAFALAQDAVSEPVVTPFGVHLIKCLEIKPGQKPWQDSAPELQLAVTK
jgi:parvulin-like peptidyl-prolyl isomerase